MYMIRLKRTRCVPPPPRHGGAGTDQNDGSALDTRVVLARQIGRPVLTRTPIPYAHASWLAGQTKSDTCFMAELPRVTPNDFVERAGVLRVAHAINDAHCVWRETSDKDIGIDGHIEYVTPEGFAPGRLVAAQVKAGSSWFDRATSDFVPFHPAEKHRRYWVAYPLPVIVVLHQTETGETLWADARAQLRISETAPVRVPRLNRFDGAGVLACLSSEGPLPTGAFDGWTVVRDMSQSDDRAQGLSFLHLFAQGMTDVANAVYFSMDVVSETLDALVADHDRSTFGVGEAEFRFVDRYVDFLITHDLARVDYGSWKQAIVERQMVGMFIAPLC